jgi:hypothetical protein
MRCPIDLAPMSFVYCNSNRKKGERYLALEHNSEKKRLIPK